MSKSRGVKLSMGEFLGDSSSNSSMPKGPGDNSGGSRDRDSRGSYGREGGYGRGDYSNNRSNDDAPEQGSWRRSGGGGDRGRSSDFGDNRRSGGGGGYYGRGGGGGGSGSGFDDYRRGGGGSGGGFDDFRRGGGGNDSRGASASSAGGQRPKLNLSKRTKPIEPATLAAPSDATKKDAESPAGQATAENVSKTDEKEVVSLDSKPKKSNPFGAATAVDTASKLQEVESKFEKKDSPAPESEGDAPEGKEKSPQTKEEVSQAEAPKTESSKPDESTAAPPKTELKFSDVARSARELPQEPQESKPSSNNEAKVAIKRTSKEELKVSNSRAAALDEGGNRATSGDKEKKSGGNRNQDQNKKNRGPPPQPVNSRFAAAAAADKDYIERSAARDRHDSNKRDNKPTRNSRFDSLKESENKDAPDAPTKDEERPKTPPPLTENTRFASMVSEDDAENEDSKNRRERSRNERDMGPPEPQNSRFAAAAAMDESNRAEFHDRPRGPPPVQQNSRFTKAIEADQDYGASRDSRPDRSFGDRQQGPPPVQQNSRFTRAMEADQDYGASRESKPERRISDREQGPPPVQQNSRFTRAMEADQDYGSNRERGERGPGDRGDRGDRERSGYYGRRDERGPPPVANSRFAAAVESDPDYRERGEREEDERRGGDRDRDRNEGGRFGDNRGGRWGEGGGRDDFRDRRGPGRFNRRGEGEVKSEELPRFPGSRQQEEQPVIAKVEDFPALKTLNKADLPRAAAPPPKVTAPIALPGETEEEALARIEKKKKEDAEKKAAEEAEAKRLEEERQRAAKEAQEVAEKAKAAEGKILDFFASGEKQGDALADWCSEQGALLPPVEKLLCHFLDTTQKKNPDVHCAWAAPEKYGTAFLSLCQDNVRNQMGVLWGIQYYCDNIGFPKLGEERVVQAMFRSMYKYDIVDEEGFFEWKEDESDDHNTGKLTAIVQTVDWFNWLEEEEEEEEEEEYEE